MEFKFYEHLSEIFKVKKTNTTTTFLNKIKYYKIFSNLKQLKQEKKTKTKLIKKYDVMTVQGNEKLIMPITEEGNYVKYYAYNELF
jgi:hypothetical protein